MSEIKERPILFSAPMVRAILAGRKTVTRRAVNPQPALTDGSGFSWKGHLFGRGSDDRETSRNFSKHCCPYGKPGDRLWVRETWYCNHFEVQKGPYLQPADMVDLDRAREDGDLMYAADGLTPYEQEQPTWKPSIHTPRWVSRILLEISDVRVERLQDITYEQAAAEGVHRGPLREWSASDEGGVCHEYPVPAFRDLWQSVGGNWDANPWVWVVEFKRVTP
ncbi:hypothetical protein J3D47_004176 [Pseudomonas laurylsulfativorans]|uniref:hypothetical protein n=1 Tax=Pseudomonas laurylsulfativorans TaxID=1943631 RepID=UPI00209E912D|nr:hypothetical protein [Pseudomonas laurylsulfativorans]MCP1419933.1 hypothetical protein [Pseudomonas laurylsulfativorans]